MQIKISNDSLLLIGLLIIVFLPQIHLLLIFTVYAIVEEFGKLFTKLIKFTCEYILPLICLYMLCLTFLKMAILVYNDFKNLLDEI
jgi:hypothetical protein